MKTDATSAKTGGVANLVMNAAMIPASAGVNDALILGMMSIVIGAATKRQVTATMRISTSPALAVTSVPRGLKIDKSGGTEGVTEIGRIETATESVLMSVASRIAAVGNVLGTRDALTTLTESVEVNGVVVRVRETGEIAPAVGTNFTTIEAPTATEIVIASMTRARVTAVASQTNVGGPTTVKEIVARALMRTDHAFDIGRAI
jgi:hypothetical protein